MARAHGVAGARLGLEHKAVEGGYDRPLNLALDDRVRGNAIEAGPEIADGDEGCGHHDGKLARGVVRTKQAGDQVVECIADLDDQPAAVPAFLLEDRACGSRYSVEHRNGLGIEADVCGTFERDRADKAVAHEQRYRQDGHRPAALRKLGMGACLVQFVGGRGMENQRSLVERLVHGEADQANEVHMAAELRAVRDRRHLGMSGPDEADADALAIEACGEFGDQRAAGASEVSCSSTTDSISRAFCA